ncbi:MAG: sugar-binding protein [Lentisphaeria bacterium]|jgi:hypothetical protein
MPIKPLHCISARSFLLHRSFIAGAAMLLFTTAIGHAEEGDIIWQLGQLDNSKQDFKIQYHAWEYGSAPHIANSPAVDHNTHTFHYDIAENNIIPAPQIVSGLYTVTERCWMQPDELVANLALTWREQEGGARRLSVACASWSNIHGGQDGIEIVLPGNKKKVLNLPTGHSKQHGPFNFDVVFDAATGANELRICVVSMAKHYSISFDCIQLRKTDRKPEFPPIPTATTEAFSGIHHPGDAVNLSVRVHNADAGNVDYTVHDLAGTVVHRGQCVLADGQAKAVLPSDSKGHFTVECRFHEQTCHCSYVVVEPVVLEYIEDSRFGCHALRGDSYRQRSNPEREEIKIRRAFLGGAKWCRLHSVKWALREPEKGRFDWQYLDERFALAAKYKQHILLAVGAQPLWASTSDDKRLTVCGDYRYLYYPPKDFADWANFLTVLSKRYGDRISHYEISNEPGYSSAFWTCGSAEAFGTYLKTAYDAIKKTQPDAVIYPGAPLQVDFLDEAIKSSGGKPTFDLLSVHYLRNNERFSQQADGWKKMLSKMGKEPKLVNSEEASWISGATSPVESAANVVKIHVREASQGVIRTFGFEMFDDNFSRKYSFFDLKDNPLPQFAAYRAMTHRLEHANYLGDLSGADYEAYLFARGDTPVVVFWHDQDGRLSLPLASPQATLVSLMDTERTVSSENGVVTLHGKAMPQFLIGGDLSLLSAVADSMAALPQKLVMTSGKNFSATMRLHEGVGLDFELPPQWSGELRGDLMTICAPANAPQGFYDGHFVLSVKDMRIKLPLVIEISNGPSANLLRNGDFEDKSRFWFFDKDKAKWDVLPEVGTDGSYAARTVGQNHFGPADAFKVRPGENYMLAFDIRGEGAAGISYSLKDAQNNRIFPEKPSINALSVIATPEWKRVHEIISINRPDAAILKFAFLTNYGDKVGKVVYIDNVILARLTNNTTASRILTRGKFIRPPGAITIDGDRREWAACPAITLNQAAHVVNTTDQNPWQGPDDLSGSCQIMLDEKNLYLLFDIRDNVLGNGVTDPETAWQYDSIQFAIDPRNDNHGYTEICVGRTSDGKGFAYKLVNYWTPELPENITRRGLINDAEVMAVPTAYGIIYELRIPINELYPLDGKESEFAFNFLINDDDGHGRKYIEWAGGIGKTKNPKEYGLLQLKE